MNSDEFRDYKEANKTDFCLHLQLLDGEWHEWFYDVMPPLSGHEQYYMLQWTEKWANESFCLLFYSWDMNVNIPKSLEPTSIKLVVYSKQSQIHLSNNTQCVFI